MDKKIYIVLGQNLNYKDDSELPKTIINIYSSYEKAEDFVKNHDFEWDVIFIEEHLLL